MDVTVVGGGIGGLVTALELHRRGIRSVVYEQGSALRELGVGFNLLPHAVRVLDDLDLVDALDAVAVRIGQLTYAHRLGQPVLQRACGQAAGFDEPQFSCHRGHVQRVLADAVRERLGPDALRLGHRVTGVTQDGSGVRARFEDGTEADSDVLVAADGIHSAVRASLFGDEGPPRWNGVQMWRGATDWPAFGRGDLLGRSMIVAGGTDAKLVVYPIGPGSSPGTVLTNWAICVRTGRDGDPPPRRQDWSRPADPAEAARHARRFHLDEVDHHALVAATAEIFEFPMCDRDPLPHWGGGRVTLLGDAAHPMFPMGSNGGGQAILDARSLAAHLALSPHDPEAALRAYADERLPVTADIVLRNRTGGPEMVIDEVERRAPDGFDRLEDVMSTDERDAIVAGYAQATGATPEQIRRG
ncbi:FAD-dependent monooxygenase [Pseudonocardia endophytica]|uniref:2-polyprenyl-6-methoxyphenol hydroxylase-like FAD-dependent oxidoreductase n=1 Tax=Pseudonocardia endophytica TaxID=401976 RepID=A0A4R1HHH3_PSEEN|nr:FAD-dependent monooxygenase [Pseudonocardia endophytica]TCK21684.1 2-polyprenyl-6-methoxyphenol hydroxylase-like FAD-dependent oxidoreductase [Pseudonocardia endophytica]